MQADVSPIHNIKHTDVYGCLLSKKSTDKSTSKDVGNLCRPGNTINHKNALPNEEKR